MSWTKLIGKMFYALGRSATKKSKVSIPGQYGYWKNNGTDKNEDWVWKDYRIVSPSVYLNIFIDNETTYLIEKSDRPDISAIDSIKCIDDKEAESTLEILIAYYSELGTVITNRRIE